MQVNNVKAQIEWQAAQNMTDTENQAIQQQQIQDAEEAAESNLS